MRNHALSHFSSARALTSDALLLAVLALIGACATGVAEAADEAPDRSELRVEISNVGTSEGMLYIQILAGEEAFKASAPAIAQFILPAAEPVVAFTLDSLPAGDYAIRVMHDLDGDGELATNMVGMPKEPWGISNNAKGRFGPPKWDAAHFTFPAVATQTIELNR